jgi:Flagellar assembly protein T, C-terminal domain
VSFQKFYPGIFGTLFLVLLVLSSNGFAQRPTPTPTLNVFQENRELPIAAGSNLYCAGYVETESVNTGSKIVGAENEQEKFTYAQGDNVYINLGANRGVKVGDKFSVIRPRGRVETRWSRKRNLGFYVQEVGNLEVVKVKNDVSVARISYSCDNFLLGDLLQPMAVRTSPVFRQRPALDVFGESSGKAAGRIFMARDSQELLGREQIVYIDLGAEDNVKVGDYLTVYRPLGTGNLFEKSAHESVSARNDNYQSDHYRGGKFSNQAARKSGERAEGKVVTTKEAKRDRPAGIRKVVGELVILNVKGKTATAIITRTAQEIHTGDSVEVQ